MNIYGYLVVSAALLGVLVVTLCVAVTVIGGRGDEE